MRQAIFTLVLLGMVANSSHGIITSDTPGSHVVTAGVPAFGINTDGVVIIGGMQESGEGVCTCSGALISDRHILSAAHCFDEDGNGEIDPIVSAFPHQAIFELAEDYVAIQYDPDSIQLPDEWFTSRGDLAVLTLDEAAPAAVPRYPLYGSNDEVGQSFVLVGYGNPGHGATGQDDSGDAQPTKRAGLNRYDAIRGDFPGVDFLAYDFDSGQPENNCLEILGFDSDLGFGPDEVFLATGDSGRPSFINGVIAAVTAFRERLPGVDVNDDLDSSWGEAGFDTRVSGFREFILNATDGTAVFVPEPSTRILVLTVILMLTRFTLCRESHRGRSLRWLQS